MSQPAWCPKCREAEGLLEHMVWMGSHFQCKRCGFVEHEHELSRAAKAAATLQGYGRDEE